MFGFFLPFLLFYFPCLPVCFSVEFGEIVARWRQFWKVKLFFVIDVNVQALCVNYRHLAGFMHTIKA